MGTNLSLIEEIDDLVNQQVKFTESINHHLYLDYIADYSREKLEGIHEETRKLAASLIEKLSSMSHGTQKFSSALDDCQQILENDPDIDTITDIVNSLVDEAASISENNSKMEDSLAEMSREVTDLKSEVETLSEKAVTDPLTGIANRRALEDVLENYCEVFESEGKIFSLLILDIDHFKQFNDTYGHCLGDKVLSYVAKKIKNSIKGDDFLARYGGEEFCILLPDTGYGGALSVADNVRRKVSEKNLTTGDNKKSVGKVTISIGVAVMNDKDSVDSLVERADKAMYQAKDYGRNRVVGERELE